MITVQAERTSEQCRLWQLYSIVAMKY